jgi:hypothetical protein
MISVVTIKLAPAELIMSFYTSKRGQANVAMDNYKSYEIRPCFAVDAEGIDAAEEAFDLTNNPSRQGEREQLYGRGRSVSVGDIVEVDGVNYLCASMGWEELEETT